MEKSAAADRISRIFRKIKGVFAWVDNHSGGLLSILHQSVKRFTVMRGAEASASLAYYALFSIFPLSFILVAILGFVLSSEEAYRRAVEFVLAIFPFSGDLVERNLTEVEKSRGAIGVIGILGALWSASGFFNTLARNVNFAWPTAKLRGPVHNRLVALGMIGALFLLLVLSLISTTLINLLPGFIERLGGDPDFLKTVQWRTLLRVAPAFFTFLMFTGLYLWVPNKVVRWNAVITGSIVVTIVWELAKHAFTLYLGSGLARYQIVYGSLSTLIVLMVWIYLSSMITLFGAHLVASIDLRVAQAEK